MQSISYLNDPKGATNLEIVVSQIVMIFRKPVLSNAKMYVCRVGAVTKSSMKRNNKTTLM